MDVLLKKTKITKSIVNQSLQGNNSLFLSHPNHDILGWCMMNGRFNVRWILMYNRISNVIIRLPMALRGKYEMFEETDQERGAGVYEWIFPKYYKLKLEFADMSNSSPVLFKSREEKETTDKKQKLHDFLEEVHIKGQIYL